MQWTEHVQAAPPPPIPQAPTQMVLHEPAPLDRFARPATYGQPNPYGMERGGGANYIPMANTNGSAGYTQVTQRTQQVHSPHNSAAIGSVILGTVAFGMSLIGLMPGSPIIYYSAGGIFAIVGGIRSLVQRHRGAGTVLWAPILAIILGSLAALIMLAEFAIHSVAENSPASGVSTSQAGAQAPAQSGTGATAETLPAAPEFSTDASLTQYEKSAALVATNLYDGYNGGVVGTTPVSWPATITESNPGQLSFPSGTSAGQIPTDEVIKYDVSSDGKYFVVLVSGGAKNEVAIYDSESNTFAWTCAPGDATCPPGALTPGTGSTDNSGTNS